MKLWPRIVAFFRGSRFPHARPTEKEMREVDVPHFKTMGDLVAYIDEVTQQHHDYGTAVYSISLAATATFHYACHVVGASGFQASCADLDIVRRTRLVKSPFMLITLDKVLYPQYDVFSDLARYVEESKPWLAAEARRLIIENGRQAHPEVRAHWEKLSAMHKGTH